MSSKKREDELKYLQQLGDELVKNPNTSDVGSMKDKLAQLDHNWVDFKAIYDDREKDVEYREQQSNRYNNLCVSDTVGSGSSILHCGALERILGCS